MNNQSVYVVIDIECVCCAHPGNTKHMIRGVFTDYEEALKVKSDAHKKQLASQMLFPHTEIVIIKADLTQ